MKRAEILGECPLHPLRLLEVAAVEGDDLPGQVVVSGGNLHGKRCHFLRRAEAPGGDLLGELGALFCGKAGIHLGVDHAAGNRVDLDAARCELLGEGAGEGIDAAFAGGVCDLAGGADISPDRGDV